MSETQNDPTFVVKLTGILSPEDIERYERGFREQLPGRVVVVDGRVEDIREMTGMQPRNAAVTVLRQRKELDHMEADGNTPRYRYIYYEQEVPVKVWPVAMGKHELLVEWEDGTLGTAKLWDIRMGVMKNANNCS